jgi:F-type H+-transporting ATPase subunit b
MELLAKLGINWQLLLAQIVNFAIVAGVLTVLVYKPLLNAIDARRERIKKSIDDAKRIERETAQLEEFRTAQLKKIDEEAGVLLQSAKKEADAAKQQILDGAQAEANRILQRGEQKLTEERARVLSEVQGNVADMILRMTQKILQREFSPADQKRLLADLSTEVTNTFR